MLASPDSLQAELKQANCWLQIHCVPVVDNEKNGELMFTLSRADIFTPPTQKQEEQRGSPGEPSSNKSNHLDFPVELFDMWLTASKHILSRKRRFAVARRSFFGCMAV